MKGFSISKKSAVTAMVKHLCGQVSLLRWIFHRWSVFHSKLAKTSANRFFLRASRKAAAALPDGGQQSSQYLSETLVKRDMCGEQEF